MYAQTEAPEKKPEPTIVLIGDSTVADPRAGQKTYGWGYFLADQLPGTKVVNLAVSGSSTKSFMHMAQFKEAKSTPATFWLIQFGHNDQKKNSPERYADPEVDYPANLRTLIEAARQAGATPVLVTPVRRLTYKSTGELGEELLPYADAVKKVAAEDKIPVIDLNTLSGNIYAAFGKDNQDWLMEDKTHFTFLGARLVSLLVAQQLQKLYPEVFVSPQS